MEIQNYFKEISLAFVIAITAGVQQAGEQRIFANQGPLASVIASLPKNPTNMVLAASVGTLGSAIYYAHKNKDKNSTFQLPKFEYTDNNQSIWKEFADTSNHQKADFALAVTVSSLAPLLSTPLAEIAPTIFKPVPLKPMEVLQGSGKLIPALCAIWLASRLMHESGHALMAMFFNHQVSKIYVSCNPIGKGRIEHSFTEDSSTKVAIQNVLISLAGPVAGGAFCVLVLTKCANPQVKLGALFTLVMHAANLTPFEKGTDGSHIYEHLCQIYKNWQKGTTK